MADAREEQIMDAFETLITGLSTTGANVARDRVHNVPDLPALGLSSGDPEIKNELMNAFIDWEMPVYVDIYEKTISEEVSAAAAAIRKEVHVAVMADHTLGLGFVINTTPSSGGETDLTGAGEQPAGKQRMLFVVWYRTSRTDISA